MFSRRCQKVFSVHNHNQQNNNKTIENASARDIAAQAHFYHSHKYTEKNGDTMPNTHTKTYPTTKRLLFY